MEHKPKQNRPMKVIEMPFAHGKTSKFCFYFVISFAIYGISIKLNG